MDINAPHPQVVQAATFEPETEISLATAATLVMWNVSKWSARKKDKDAAKQVAEANGVANASKISVSKMLIDCPELRAIGTFEGWVRNNYHYPNSLPWSDCGMRLVSGQIAPEYWSKMKENGEYGQEFMRLVDEFLKVYIAEQNRARFELGSMFDESLYPSVDEVRSKFKWKLVPMPVPVAGDFRVDVSQQFKDELAAEFDAFHQAELKEVMDGLWGNLRVAIVELAEKLDFDQTGKKNKLFSSRIDTFNGLLKLMETCNYTNDPVMEKLHRDLVQTFDGLTVEQLRVSDTLRERTMEDLDNALKQLPSLGF